MADDLITSEELGSAYVKCGGVIGYFWAEALLLRYLPKDNPGGRCSDVPHKNRKAFLADLENAIQYGCKVTDHGLVVLTS